MSLTNEEQKYVLAIKGIRTGLAFDPDFDDGYGKSIEEMTPIQRVGLITAWYYGDRSLAYTFKDYFESQGLYLTTNPNADGVIK